MGLGTTSVDGLMSGLDTTAIIKSLSDIRRRPINLLEQRVSERTQALSSYQSLATQVMSLQAAAAVVADGSVFQARTVTVSDTSSLLAYAGSGAAVGRYQITVDHLAQAHKVASGQVADPKAALGFTGDFLLNGQVISLQADDSLSDLCEAINNASARVSATVLHVSNTEHRLVLTGLQTGAVNALDLVDANPQGFLSTIGLTDGITSLKHTITNGAASDYFDNKFEALQTNLSLTVAPSGNITINGTTVSVDLAKDSLQNIADRINETVVGTTATVKADNISGSVRYRLELVGDMGAPVLTDAGGVLQTLGLHTQGLAHELQAAHNSRITVDGYAIERATNQVDDAIEGVSLDLLKANAGSALTLTIASDPEAAVTAMQRLVSSYNTVNHTITDGLSFDTETNRGGIFFSDITISGIQRGLYQLVMGQVTTLGGALNLPSQLGLSVDQDGILSLDASRLRQVLARDSAGVVKLLTTSAETTHDEVEFLNSTADTGDTGRNGLSVVITQAATQAIAHSAELAEGITQTETLTIGGRYNITLMAGDSLERAADKLNAVFQGNGLSMIASVVEGRLQIQSKLYGSHYSIAIQSSLARGTGGTDFGGIKANTEMVYAGQDVHGTIGGQEAQGWGQWLTGITGGTKGLRLKVTSTTPGDKGLVRVSQGIGSRLSAYAANLTETKNGSLTRAANDVNETITSLRNEIAKMAKRVQAYTENLQLRFAAIESIMARNNALQSYLTTQISGLQSQFNHKA